MTRFALIRHAATESYESTIIGRYGQVHLSATGLAQAERLRTLLGAVDAIYSSPQARARETAQALVYREDKQIQVAQELDELDYGDWSGRRLRELATLASWQAFNSVRSCTRIPNGEHILDVQARVVQFMERVRNRHPAAIVALVSHADVVRAALAHCLGIPIDLSLRLEISLASISIVALEQSGPRVDCVNRTEQ
jgi:broad specificity phosphatase PhoE